MGFNNLKRNDIVFSESKGSRVFKLISKNNNEWIVEDVFSKQSDIIKENDQVKVVKTDKKSKPFSMSKLFESSKVSIRPTLTEKEIFIVEELKDSFEESYSHDVIAEYENGNLDAGSKLLDRYLKVLNVSKKSQYDLYSLIQYVYCAIENYDNEISTSTNINRFKLFELKATEITDERKYQNWTLDVPALDLDMITKMQSGILDNFWNYDPDAGWADYGDSQFIALEDVEIDEPALTEYHKPLVIE